MTAQISFIDGQFSLIHIPLSIYSSLLQPILQMLLPGDGVDGSLEGLTESLGDMSLQEKHGFLNISITPIECSIVCNQAWAQKIFQPAIEQLSKEMRQQVSISKTCYMVFSVSSAGMEAGQRVIDLTAPLALAGVPIFFITTYYTDFILVPTRDHKSVVQALISRGFEFSESDSAYVAPTPISHTRGGSSSSPPPSTPPPSNMAELQVRTFNQLRKRSVVPFIVPGLELVQCSGKEIGSSDDYSRSSSNRYSFTNGNGNGNSNSNGNGNGKTSHWLDGIDAKLYIGLVAALARRPRFLSLTLSKDDAPSLLVDKAILSIFGDTIAGDTEGSMHPVFLNLSSLPLESTGIVCGVAGKLVDDMRLENAEDTHGAGLSYLSTARAGAVILSAEGSARALEVLVPLLQKDG